MRVRLLLIRYRHFVVLVLAGVAIAVALATFVPATRKVLETKETMVHVQGQIRVIREAASRMDELIESGAEPESTMSSFKRHS